LKARQKKERQKAEEKKAKDKKKKTEWQSKSRKSLKASHLLLNGF
jgi:hypothetical protein